MEQTQPSLFKYSINYGLITGLILVVYSLLLYFTNLNLDQTMGYISFLILAACIFFTGKHYRDSVLHGSIAYAQALGLGVLVGVFASVLLGFFSYLELKFIDPSIIDKQLELTQQKMVEKGLNEEQLEMAMKVTKQWMTPAMSFIISIFSFAFISLIISLITSIFIRKDTNPFDTAMQDNN